MIAKPSFLGPKYGSAFEDETVVASYHTRPPYPEEVFELLAALLAPRPGAVLDLGCGPGIVARRLVDLGEHVERVDALDASPAMLAEGQRLPNGDHPRLRWILGRAEDAPLQPPYSLMTAAASFHWMDRQTVLPRLHDALAPDGILVIIGGVVQVGLRPGGFLRGRVLANPAQSNEPRMLALLCLTELALVLRAFTTGGAAPR